MQVLLYSTKYELLETFELNNLNDDIKDIFKYLLYITMDENEEFRLITCNYIFNINFDDILDDLSVYYEISRLYFILDYLFSNESFEIPSGQFDIDFYSHLEIGQEEYKESSLFIKDLVNELR